MNTSINNDKNAEIKPIWAKSSEIMELLGISRGALSNLQRSDHFPKPIRLGYNIIRWNFDEVQAWIEQRRGERK